MREAFQALPKDEPTVMGKNESDERSTLEKRLKVMLVYVNGVWKWYHVYMSQE